VLSLCVGRAHLSADPLPTCTCPLPLDLRHTAGHVGHRRPLQRCRGAHRAHATSLSPPSPAIKGGPPSQLPLFPPFLIENRQHRGPPPPPVRALLFVRCPSIDALAPPSPSTCPFVTGGEAREPPLHRSSESPPPCHRDSSHLASENPPPPSSMAAKSLPLWAVAPFHRSCTGCAARLAVAAPLRRGSDCVMSVDEFPSRYRCFCARPSVTSHAS
jgi:hypothetical protein